LTYSLRMLYHKVRVLHDDEFKLCTTWVLSLKYIDLQGVQCEETTS